MKTLTTALLILVSLTSFGQTAEELNEQSKQLLQNREFDKVFPPRWCAIASRIPNKD